jgi:predicted metal-dependent hydrolase
LRKKKVNYTDTYVVIGEYKVPLRIHIERRSTIRIAVGKDNVLLRVPLFASTNLLTHIKTAEEWLTGISESQPELLEKYHVSKYELRTGLQLLGKDQYILKLEVSDSQDLGEIKLSNTDLVIKIPSSIDEFEKRIMVRNLLSKLFAKRYKKFVEERVRFWNERFFQKNVKSVTLRYNSTNWGSCSTTGKINISTRSLLLPLDVFDYILVHELSHLVEMNHSDRFWNVVKKVMPNYETAEKWIRDNASKLDF